MLSDSDIGAPVKGNRDNKERVACLENKANMMRERLEAVVASLRVNPSTIIIIIIIIIIISSSSSSDGRLLTNAGTVPGEVRTGQ